MTTAVALRPLHYCTVCDDTVRHVPIVDDTSHCECRFDGPLPCECDCHSETLPLVWGKSA